MPYVFYAISLDPEGPRYRTFAACNAHLEPITVFKAIKGADIPREDRVSSGLITQDVLVGGITDGTLGCAASHRALWQTIAAGKEGAVIMEDDVVTHPGLIAFMDANPKLLRQTEIVFFSVNTDSVLSTMSTQGLVTDEIMRPQHPDIAWIDQAFAKTQVTDVKPFRLLKGFGLCCYWLNPYGAKRLLDSCFPLTMEGTQIPFMKNPWPGSAIDGRMNAFLPNMSAWITRPFLAYSPNTDSSTSR